MNKLKEKTESCIQTPKAHSEDIHFPLKKKKKPKKKHQYIKKEEGKRLCRQEQSFGKKSDFTVFSTALLCSPTIKMLGGIREPDPKIFPIYSRPVYTPTNYFFYAFSDIQLVQKHVFNKEKKISD